MQKVKAEIVETDEEDFGERVETGVVEFEYNIEEDEIDWPGIFIRGDQALMHFAPALTYLLDCANINTDDDIHALISVNACKGLRDLLLECAVKQMVE